MPTLMQKGMKWQESWYRKLIVHRLKNYSHYHIAMNIIVECPHCSGTVIIEQINCSIFRHGVYISNGSQMNPHECKEVCDNLASTNQIYGCGKPFKLTKNEDGMYLARYCEYI